MPVNLFMVRVRMTAAARARARAEAGRAHPPSGGERFFVRVSMFAVTVGIARREKKRRSLSDVREKRPKAVKMRR